VNVVIDYDACENTAVCEEVCPEDVFERVDGRTLVVNPANCTNCWICVDNCVAASIKID